MVCIGAEGEDVLERFPGHCQCHSSLELRGGGGLEEDTVAEEEAVTGCCHFLKLPTQFGGLPQDD